MNPHLEWSNLLIDTALARGLPLIASNPVALRIPEIESITVSGLLIRGVSLLDEAIQSYIDEKEIIVCDRNPKLFHRLRALHNAGRLVDYHSIDFWRARRNDVGHKVADIYSWVELEDCQAAIFRELSNLQILNEFPCYELSKTTKRVPPSAPGISIEQEISITVALNGKSVREVRWRLQV